MLNLIHQTSSNFSNEYQSIGYLDVLFQEDLKLHTSALLDPARQAICSMLKNDKEKTLKLLDHLEKSLFNRNDAAHQVSQNIF